MLDWIKTSADWLAVVVGGLVAAGLVVRWLAKRVSRAYAKWDNAREVLVGREEIRHPDTGVVLVDATPSLGFRIAGIEDTLVTLSDTRSEMSELTRKVGDLADALNSHISEANDLEHERTKEREEMWKAIQAVATPQPWDGIDRRTQGGSDDG